MFTVVFMGVSASIMAIRIEAHDMDEARDQMSSLMKRMDQTVRKCFIYQDDVANPTIVSRE